MTTNIAIILAAILQVESGGNANAVGSHGDVGVLQIRPCVVDDVNRIYDTNYKYSDRRDPVLSMEMAEKYLRFWASDLRVKKMLKREATDRDIVLCWNRGPRWFLVHYKNGPKKDRYWLKVRKQIAAIAAGQEK